MFPPRDFNPALRGLINSMHSASPASQPLFRPPMAVAIASPPRHFLDLPHQHDISLSSIVPDTSTVAAHDFDVDANTGFMPTTAPLGRIPIEVSEELQTWERTLNEGLALGMKLGDQLHLFDSDETEKNDRWRVDVRALPVLDPSVLETDVLLLRRGHHVLVSLMHLYIHSAPPPAPDAPTTPHVVPACIALPLVRISSQLGIAPILTYADTVLWNWHTPQSHPLALPTESALRSRTLLSGTLDEEHFYLTSAKIELRGVAALGVMRSTLDELFIGDATAVRRIAGHLTRLSSVIDELTGLLLAVRDRCDPTVFYHQVRPWLRGATNDKAGWVFEGVDDPDVVSKISNLSGPSAGQSSLIHALDIFLGVNHERGTESAYLTVMEQYMPRHHRLFLQHLRRPHRHLREFVLSTHAAYTAQTIDDRGMRWFAAAASSSGLAPRASLYQSAGLGESGVRAATELQSAYDGAVSALKRFRDGHIKIATLYIVNQARGTCQMDRPGGPATNTIKGTGGTSLVPFLKECRDNTVRAMVHPPSPVPRA